MRLIDADALMDCIDKNCDDSFAGMLKALVKRQPTAFDKEKVIEELMKCSDDPCTLHECGVRSEYCSACMAKKAIEIVEKGGIEWA